MGERTVRILEDNKIVQLYWERNQDAIPATAEKYGAYCASIARNILGNYEDAEECVNDTYMSAWNSIPPHKPSVLSTFLGKITRNLSITRHRTLHAQKRGKGQTHLVLNELTDCVSGRDDPESAYSRQELIEAINDFLRSLPAEKRSIFLCRYWYFDSISEIAYRFNKSDNAVSVTLNRLRSQLRHCLTERGFDL